MYGVSDNNANVRREEILRANSVKGRVENLNQRMDALKSSERMSRMNDIKNNFR